MSKISDKLFNDENLLDKISFSMGKSVDKMKTFIQKNFTAIMKFNLTSVMVERLRDDVVMNNSKFIDKLMFDEDVIVETSEEGQIFWVFQNLFIHNCECLLPRRYIPGIEYFTDLEKTRNWLLEMHIQFNEYESDNGDINLSIQWIHSDPNIGDHNTVEFVFTSDDEKLKDIFFL